MFYERFKKLCDINNTTPNAVCKELKLSTATATATHWKNGTMPKGDVLSAIANYFNISVDYLLGRTEEPNISFRDIETIKKIKSLDFEDYVEVINYISKKCRK